MIFRCCQKALRQFYRWHHSENIDWLTPPVVDYRDRTDQLIDLRESIDQLREPLRTVIRLYCDGMSVAQISAQMMRSNRR